MKTVTTGIRFSERELEILTKKCEEISNALGLTEGKFKVTRSDVIKYCLWDSLKLFPESALHPKLVGLKNNLVGLTNNLEDA